MSVVHDAVADRIGVGGIADVVVPLRDGKLTGHNRGAEAMPIIEDLDEISTFLITHWRVAPVIEDEHVNASELGEVAYIGAICACKCELVGQTRGTTVDRTVPL